MVTVIIYGVGFQFAWGTIPWIYPAVPRIQLGHGVFIVSPSQPDSAQRLGASACLSMPQRCKHEGLSNLVAFDLGSRLTRLGLMPHQEIFSMAEKAPWA